MLLTNALFLQVNKLIPVLALSYVLVLGLLSSVAIIGAYYNIPIVRFTGDPTVILGGRPFTGVISNVGVLFWCATSAICFFSFAIYGKTRNALTARFLLFSGLLTLLLLLDDLFVLHETIFPVYFHIPQTAVYLGYLILISMYFYKFKEIIAETEYTLLFIACSFFGVSVISDIFLPQKGLEYLVEDGFKLFGIVTWFIYFIRTCFIQIQEAVPGQSDRKPLK